MTEPVDITYSLGTVSVANGTTTVTLVGGLWESVNARQWDMIQIGTSNTLVPITSVTDTLHAEIPEWEGTTQVDVPYVIYHYSPTRYVGGKAMADVDDMLAKLNTEGWYRYVNPIYAGPTEAGIVANEGQFALKYTTGQLWIMSGGAWVLVGVFKAFNPRGAWNNATAYLVNDFVSYNGSSYIALQDGTNHLPTDTAYWQLLASKGDTGASGLAPIVNWTTATNYVAGPPASFVAINGSSYACVVPHTSGVFATDLAAGKWILVAHGGIDGTNGVTPLTPLTAWATATAYVAGPPASFVSINGASYACLVSHTSGVFATDLAAGKWGVIASGSALGALDRYLYIATAGQTVFTGVDSNGATLANSGAGFTECYVNGWLVPPSDYTVNSAAQITTSYPLAAGDYFYIVCYKPFAVGDAYSKAAEGSDIVNKPLFRFNLKVDNTTLSKNATYNVVAADYAALIKLTGSATLTFTAAATLGDGWKCVVRNTSTGIWTIDPNGSELIDGKTTIKIYPDENFTIYCDGVGFYTVGRATGLISIYKFSFAAVASVTTDAIFTTDFDEYEIALRNLVPSATQSLAFQWRRSGATITAANYSYGYTYVNATATAFAGGSNAGGGIILMDGATPGGGAGDYSATIQVINPMGNVGLIKHIKSDVLNNNLNFARYSGGGSFIGDALANDGFVIFPTAGTFSGSMEIYGKR